MIVKLKNFDSNVNNMGVEEPEEMKVDNDCELIWAKLKIKGSKDLYIGSCYRPPDIRDS
jgi:hypothetical protein